MINTEFNVFLVFVLLGIIISFLFDFFRILRRVYKTPDFITILEDIVFWIISGIIILSGIFILNEGKIRAYLFLGLFAGITIYIITLSKFITKIGIIFFKSINKILFIPILKIIRSIYKMIYKLVKKLKKIIYSTNLKIKKIRK